MKIGISIMMLAVCATRAVLAVAQQQQATMTVASATPAPQSEMLKALQAAMQEKDAAKRVTMLEAFIRDNPNSSVLSAAYSALLSTLWTTDRAKAGKLADELLAKYTDPKSPIRRAAYSSKFMSLTAQKKTDEIHSLAQKVLEYLGLSAPTDSMEALESRSSLEMMRADIYQKMGKPDLQMESYTKAHAAPMDASTRDKITDLAKKTGSAPEKVFARALRMHKESATLIKPFELKSIEGKVTTLASVTRKLGTLTYSAA
jgi:tetratricopeptide (TPR) repeat protein